MLTRLAFFEGTIRSDREADFDRYVRETLVPIWRQTPCAARRGHARGRGGWLPRHLDIDRTSNQDVQEIVLATNLTPANASGSRRHSKR